jgi:hypothetical protein
MVIGSRAVSANDCISAPDGVGDVFKRRSSSVTSEHSSFPLWFFLGWWVDDVCSTIWVVWDEEAISNLPDIEVEAIGKLRVGEEHWYLQQQDHPLCGFS